MLYQVTTEKVSQINIETDISQSFIPLHFWPTIHILLLVTLNNICRKQLNNSKCLHQDNKTKYFRLRLSYELNFYEC